MAALSVLIPLDGSKAAELAIAALDALTPLGSLKLRLLSVVEPDAAPHSRATTASYLDEVARHAGSRLAVDVDTICREGSPVDEILEEASSAGVDLVVMCTHGHTSDDPEHLGRVAGEVLRGVSCPILLVGSHAGVPLAIERITVPLDGSRLAAEALPLARHLAEALDASLRLVRAVPYEPTLDPDDIGSLAEDVVDSLQLTASLYLAEARLELETQRPAEMAVLRGPPAEALLRDLQENPPDLVIMTSHGHSGFVRWALGSVTERLVRGPVPVLVVPASEGGGSISLLGKSAQA